MLKKYLILCSLVLALIVALYKFYDYSVFRITNVNPGVDNVSTITPFFKIGFNKKISAQGLDLKLSPTSAGSYKIDDKTLTITLNVPLNSSQKYEIELTSISSSDGKKIINKKYLFQPKYIAPNKLPKDQQQALLASQANYSNIVQNDKLVKYLPFTSGGLEFKIDYNVESGQNSPKITIVIDAPTQKGKQDALNWIRSLGVNPGNYKIIYSNEQAGE